MKYFVTVRGMLKADAKASQKAHDEIVTKLAPMSRAMGDNSHHSYLNSQNPKEFLAVDGWDNLEALQKLYSDPNLAAEFGKLFEGMPEVTVWSDSGWVSY